MFLKCHHIPEGYVHMARGFDDCSSLDELTQNVADIPAVVWKEKQNYYSCQAENGFIKHEQYLNRLWN